MMQLGKTILIQLQTLFSLTYFYESVIILGGIFKIKERKNERKNENDVRLFPHSPLKFFSGVWEFFFCIFKMSNLIFKI